MQTLTFLVLFQVCSHHPPNKSPHRLQQETDRVRVGLYLAVRMPGRSPHPPV